MNYKIMNDTGISELFNKFAIIILHGKNNYLLSEEAVKLAKKIAGPRAEEEMRLSKYNIEEIALKREEMLSNLKTKSFFPGRSVVVLKGLSEREDRFILDLEKAWQLDDPLTVITMNELSNNSPLRKIATKSKNIALIHHPELDINTHYLEKKLLKSGIKTYDDNVIEVLQEYSKYLTEDILEKEIEKLGLFKLNDNKPLTTADLFNVMSVDHETNEFELAFALAEKDIQQIEKNFFEITTQRKNPITTLQFLNSYFNKILLIKTFGLNSYEVKREYPFLISENLARAKKQANYWKLEQLNAAINSLTLCDLSIRKNRLIFQYEILYDCFYKILDL